MTICGNGFLAEHFSRSSRVHVLPTAVDTERYVPRASRTDGPWVIGWSGTSGGFRYLYDLEPALEQVLASDPDIVLRIVADRCPAFTRLPTSRISYVPWRSEDEVRVLQTFDVGLMPLDDSVWSRGKCSYKMLTYMACAIPSVVSPVGMNAELLGRAEVGIGPRSKSEWIEAILTLRRDDGLRTHMGRAGRQLAESSYARSVIGPRLAQLLLNESSG